MFLTQKFCCENSDNSNKNFYYSLSGTLPFADDYGTPASDQIKKGRFRFNHPSWRSVSQRAKDLISEMLVVDAKRRPTIDEVLQHSWLQDNDMKRTANHLMKIEPMETCEKADNFLEPPKKRTRR